jgi:hypothetical protein
LNWIICLPLWIILCSKLYEAIVMMYDHRNIGLYQLCYDAIRCFDLLFIVYISLVLYVPINMGVGLGEAIQRVMILILTYSLCTFVWTTHIVRERYVSNDDDIHRAKLNSIKRDGYGENDPSYHRETLEYW